MHLLIIGGSDAGISAALRAQELDPRVEATIVLADDYPNYSICGLPYYLSGETPNWRDLAHRAEFPGINILRRHVARSIDLTRKSVATEHQGGVETLAYDRLVIATGAKPVQPELIGVDLDGVFFLHTMKDSFEIHRHLDNLSSQKAVLIGAGYIGLELADAFTQRGLKVTLLSRSAAVLPTVEPPLGRMVQDELQRHGVRVLTNVGAAKIERGSASAQGSRLIVTDSAGAEHLADVVVLAVGARPDSGLAAQAGVKLGFRDAIKVSHDMRTNLPDVFAAGDCVETYHRLFRDPTYISLGISLTSKAESPARMQLAARGSSPAPSALKA